jgi:hypothetical protein
MKGKDVVHMMEERGESEGCRVTKETKGKRDKTKKWARILMN